MNLTCYCPCCGAYLFTLGETRDLKCDLCGAVFDLEPERLEEPNP